MDNIKFRKNAMKTIKKLEQEVLLKQEKEKNKERLRISEELHDGILGKLFGTRLGLEFLNFTSEQDQEKYQFFLKELKKIEKEIRDVSHKLSINFNNSEVAFESIIRQLLEEKSQIGGFDSKLKISKDINWKTFDEIKKVELYRILQEVLQNIIKHASAKSVEFNFLRNEDNILIELQDNGIGFDLSKLTEGIGLNNIRSRINRLKGSLQIDSIPNSGTVLHIKIPHASKNPVLH